MIDKILCLHLAARVTCVSADALNTALVISVVVLWLSLVMHVQNMSCWSH